MSSFKDHFSTIASQYRAFRPDYPPELFSWLAGTVSRHELALDCGCGNGQASVALSDYFERVIAIDGGEEQIRHAVKHPKVTYRVAPAEATGVASDSVDLIVVAQALHWFDLSRFYPEVRRVGRSGAAVAAFTYGLVKVNEQVDRPIQRLYRDILGGYWPRERGHVDSGYRTLPFPFPEIAAPPFSITRTWTLPELVGYLSTWSGLNAYQRRTGMDALASISPELEQAWGPPQEPRAIFWPLTVRAGRIHE